MRCCNIALRIRWLAHKEPNVINAAKKTVRFKCDEIVSLNSELEEKRRRTVAKLKESNITSKQSKRTKSKIVEKSSAIVQNKFPLKGSTNNNQYKLYYISVHN